MAEPLFKFVASPLSVQKILCGQLKFATIRDLNDPNEMLAEMNVQAVAESRTELRRTGFSELQFEWLVHQAAVLQRLAPHMQAIPLPRSRQAASEQLHSRFYDNLSVMEKLHRQTVELMQDRVGMLSLTSTYSSFPMWAHYAANASGFVVEFRDLHKVFPGDKTGSLNALKQVEYLAEPSGMTFDPATQDKLFFSKHLAWSYEQEWRVVLPLDDCDELVPGLHLKKIDISHVTGVILGWQCRTEDRDAVIQAVASTNPNAVVKHATIQHGKIILQDVHMHSERQP